MEIILIRHGKSEHSDLPRLNIHEYKGWKMRYDDLGVLTSHDTYYTDAFKNIERIDFVFTSILNRTKHSLNLLRPDIQATPHEIFNEVNFKAPNLRGIRLNSRLWSFLSGALWYFGCIRDPESKKQVKTRAANASDLLIRTAEEGTVALIGHGFFNLYICKELTNRGWKELTNYSTKNWSCTRLVKF